MANEKTPTVQAANAEAVGPKVEELISKFKEQSIPLEMDFKTLINIADVGRRAVGLSPDQPDNDAGNGMVVNSDGKLEVKAKTDAGINVDKDGVAVKVNDKAGLVVDGNGLAIVGGAGLKFSQDGELDVQVDDNYGIILGSGAGSKLCINPGSGIKVDKDGVSVKFNAKAFQFSDKELDLRQGIGWAYGPNGNIDIQVDGSGGLQCGGIGAKIGVKPGSGIKVDGNGVSVDLSTDFMKKLANLIIPKGTVVPFFGGKVPEGWAFCNGENGTPDLTGCIISGGVDMTDKHRYDGVNFIPVECGSSSGHQYPLPYIMKM
ncbi:phage tail protein [Pseudomonas sp. SWRI79]|uniref:Phage tail protein n=1 Tax=Pseudomonas farris TaxID=2841207 RepID=A0ABS6PZH2_9PSED|nr:phage tail protein [Pseudomonas farris]MBV4465865.1 phage tail protein [Pseudomonas farris]